MLLTFKKLSAQGFKSFKDQQVVPFDKLPTGLIFLTGMNSVEPDLGANGAGKSSVWDALVWVLYGKTVRGLKAGNVKNWDSKVKCEVVLQFSVDKTDYTISRTWQPIALKLTKNNKKPRIVSQEELEGIIGLDHKSFIQTIVMGQFSDMFFDLSATAKSDLFSSVLDTDKWLEYSARAKASSSSYDSDLSLVKDEYAELLGEIKQLKKIDYIDSIKSWRSSQDMKLSVATSEATEFQEALATSRDKIPKLKSRVIKSEKLVKEAQYAIDDISDHITELADEVTKLKKKADSIRGLVMATKKSAKKYDDAGNECPYCEQTITKKYKKEKVSELKALLTEYDDRIAGLETIVAKKGKKINKLYRGLSDASDAKHEVQMKHIEVTNKLESVRQDVRNYQERLARSISTAKAIQKEKNPFTILEKEVKQELRSKKQAAKDLKKDMIALATLIDSIDYWKKGFKDVRLLLIKEALLQFEVEVNNCLQVLGLKDWSVTFDVDTETASGTIRKGFVVLINSPHNPKPVPWEAWCGGESQRLRLAGNMGLANLILNRKGIETNLEVWDEPSTWLSSKGITDLMDALYYRATDLNKQLWMVDHRSIDYGNFAKVITVEKTNEGSLVKL